MRRLLEGMIQGLEKAAGRPPRAPRLDLLQRNRVQLTPGERATIMANKAVWHHAWRNNKQLASPAVWKAITPAGETWYVTGTHRYAQARPTLRGAIHAYHNGVKQTA